MSMKPSIPFEPGDNSVSTPTSLLPLSASQNSASLEMSKMHPGQTVLPDIEFPLFEEATQTAARFLGIPICFVGLETRDTLILKTAIGLSQLGLINPLARTRRLSLNDSLVKSVLRKKRSLVLPHINDLAPHAQSALVREYGIQSYLGIPLLTADGNCLGVLAAMDVQPHTFSAEAIAFMELLARWSVSEYERQQLSEVLTHPVAIQKGATPPPSTKSEEGLLLDTVRLTLMSQLTQDMRNPLTTIMGMANMLSREIYGTLTAKQREYADIVRDTSQYLLEITNEVLELSSLDARIQPLHPTPIDIDMIGQHVQQMLAAHAEQKNLEVWFTVEPESRLQTLDRDVVRQLIYHLLFCIIQLSGEAGTLRIHCAGRDNTLNITISLTHPWLGEGLPSTIVALHKRLDGLEEEAELLTTLMLQATGQGEMPLPDHGRSPHYQNHPEVLQSREMLSLLLSRHLIKRHDGTLKLHGSIESGYRFMIALPSLSPVTVAR